ncbi:MAG: hypothetical protein HC854_01720 [Flavobacterium sp.]|nr:hypothetical protein [Flavobacterium sp.]
MLYKSKNRTFNYKPRFSKENGEQSNYDSYLKKDLISKDKGFQQQNRKLKRFMPISILLLILVLLLIGMSILDAYIK